MKKIVLIIFLVAAFSVIVAHAEANYVKDDAKVLSQSQVKKVGRASKSVKNYLTIQTFSAFSLTSVL